MLLWKGKQGVHGLGMSVGVKSLGFSLGLPCQLRGRALHYYWAGREGEGGGSVSYRPSLVPHCMGGLKVLCHCFPEKNSMYRVWPCFCWATGKVLALPEASYGAPPVGRRWGDSTSSLPGGVKSQAPYTSPLALQYRGPHYHLGLLCSHLSGDVENLHYRLLRSEVQAFHSAFAACVWY